MTVRQIAIVAGVAGLLLALLLVGRLLGGRTAAPVSLIEQAERRASAGPAGTAERRRATAGYTKREGLHIDIPYLSGRRLSEIPPDVTEDQLGAEISREELPEAEEHIVFARAELWTYDGRIYRIRKGLAHPMDIPTALGTSGFPLDLGTPVVATNEVRWNRTWNQRKISLQRTLSDGRLYDQIDVWRLAPKELD